MNYEPTYREKTVTYITPETRPPTEQELAVLRNEVDPYRYIIGRE